MRFWCPFSFQSLNTASRSIPHVHHPVVSLGPGLHLYVTFFLRIVSMLMGTRSVHAQLKMSPRDHKQFYGGQKVFPLYDLLKSLWHWELLGKQFPVLSVLWPKTVLSVTPIVRRANGFVLVGPQLSWSVKKVPFLNVLAFIPAWLLLQDCFKKMGRTFFKEKEVISLTLLWVLRSPYPAIQSRHKGFCWSSLCTMVPSSAVGILSSSQRAEQWLV